MLRFWCQRVGVSQKNQSFLLASQCAKDIRKNVKEVTNATYREALHFELKIGKNLSLDSASLSSGPDNLDPAIGR